ncbi:MAG: glycosyltransferase family 2 protein [Ignavibacteriae bacterium]|nr:glycosyltransferase family 2 protein [Ignavibacteriota bacterium]
MLDGQRIGVIIPALNEEQSIAHVIEEIPSCVDEIVIVDNGSTDRTSERALSAGATVLHEPQQGYGYACLRGIHHLQDRKIDVVVFIDGDYSDHPEELIELIAPIFEGKADLVIGSRMIGERETGAMLPQALFGNWLATTLIRIFWSQKFTDLGPFRAIHMTSLLQLQMKDCTYGWTVEMQIKAAKYKLRCMEVPVRYRKRIGKSKITGTLIGTVKASAKILYTIFRYALAS